MFQELHRLVYYSRNRADTEPESMPQTIQGILAASRRNNASLGVTGALMFNMGCFGQVLEGPRAAVEHIFERIQQDARHDDVSILSFGPAAERSFDRWSMGFVGESATGLHRYGAIAEQSGYDPSGMTGDDLLATLHRLVLEEEAAV